MTDEEKFNNILQIINDYREELMNDAESMDNLMGLLGNYLSSGHDMDSEEIGDLHQFLKNKINEFAKRAH